MTADALFPELVQPVTVRDFVPGAEALKLAVADRPHAWDGLFNHARQALALADEVAGTDSTRWVLFSGGNDSLVLLHALAFGLGVRFDGVLHVNTGTGVIDQDGRPVTTDFARATVEGWGFPFVEIHPPESFEDVFIEQGIIDGLPGPGLHRIAYARLKQRAIERFVQQQKRTYWSRVQLLTGIRWSESTRRMGYAERIVNRERAQVWANPIYYAGHDQMKEYRREHGLPVNPVAEHLHMSGECLCGSFAHPGELDEVRLFFPATAARIEGWERRCRDLGRTYWRWGHRRTVAELAQAAARIGGQLSLDDLAFGGDLCASCDAATGTGGAG